jgi:uncharacterized protein YvpB
MAHKKKIILIILSSLLVVFLVWVMFELLVDDVKGKENKVKKIYYKIIALTSPIKPAIKLVVPFHRQEHALSCEVASLLMALKYRGVVVTESELIKDLPVSDSGARRANNIWGDPNLGFVGNINGRMPNTGYGVYEQPIYDLALKYRSAKIMDNEELSGLIAELVNGNPLVVWGVTGKGKDISWTTPNGKAISAKMDEHARLLIGYTGESNNPKLIILLDPVYGEIRMKASDFLTNWAKLDKRAVVIY